jgi:ketosteroid isomerase-like protein
MIKNLILFVSFVFAVSASAMPQNTNSSTTARPRPSNTNKAPTTTKTTTTPKTPTGTQQPTDTSKPATSKPAPRSTPPKPSVKIAPTADSTAVVEAFNKLLDGIRHSDPKAVTSVYWNSPRLALFNNNGTVTKGWDQLRKNRENSYPNVKDVKLEVKDLAVSMLGRDGAVVTCLWTQSQTYKGTPEAASGRMTLVFKRIGKDWKVIHLHTSPEAPNATVVMPSEQTPSSTPSPTPTPTP